MPMNLQPIPASISREPSVASVIQIRTPEEPIGIPNLHYRSLPAGNAVCQASESDSSGSEPETTKPSLQAPSNQKSKRKKRKKHGGFSSSSPPVHANPDDYEQKYPEDAHGYEMGPNARVWRTYLDEAETFDTNMVEGWKDDIDVLLTFAGLFSAVVTTFVAQTSQKFEVDQTEFVASLLHEVIGVQRAMANGFPTDTVSLTASPTPSATSYDIWTNGLWFTSLSFSLATALGAVLAKQWLQHYSSTTSGTQQQRVRIRQFRYIGLRKWGVPVIIALLPILLHIAVFLFFIGLVVFLVPLNRPIAYVVAAIGGIVYTTYTLSLVLAAISLQCPYKSPLTLTLHHLFVLAVDGLHATGHVIGTFFRYIRHGAPIWMQDLAKPFGKYWAENCVAPLNAFSIKKLKPKWLKQLSKQWRTHYAKRWPLDAEILFVGNQAHGEVLEAEAMRWLLTSSSNPTAHAIVAKALPARGFNGIENLNVQPEDTDIGRLLENSQVRSRLLVAVTGIEVVDNQSPGAEWQRDLQIAERLFQACHHVNLSWRNYIAPIFSTIFNPRSTGHIVRGIQDLNYAECLRVDEILSEFPTRATISNYLATCIGKQTKFAPVVWTGLFEVLSAVHFAHTRRDIVLGLDHAPPGEEDNFAQRWKSLEPLLSVVPFPVHSGGQPAETLDIHVRVHNQLLPTALTSDQNTCDHDICHAIMASALLIFGLPEDSKSKEGLAQPITEGISNLHSGSFHTDYGIISIIVWLNCLCRLEELPPQDQARVLYLASSHLLYWSIHLNGYSWASVVSRDLVRPIVEKLVFSNHFLSSPWPAEAGGVATALYFFLFQEHSDERKKLVNRLCTNRPRYHLVPALIHSVLVITPPDDHYTVAWAERSVHFPNIENQHMLAPISEILCEWSPMQAAISGFVNPMSEIGPYLAMLVNYDFLSAVSSHSSRSSIGMKGRLSERAWEKWVADGHAAAWMMPSRRLMSTVLTLFLMMFADHQTTLEANQRQKILDYFFAEEGVKSISEILIATSFVSKWWLPGPRAYHVVRFDYDLEHLDLIKQFQSISPTSPGWKAWIKKFSEDLNDYFAHVLEGHRLELESKEVADYNMLCALAREIASLVGHPVPSFPSYSVVSTPIREKFRYSFHSAPQSPTLSV